MPAWIALAVLLGLVLLIGWRIGLERRVFVLRVEAGRIMSVKGRIPARLLGDLQDVLAGSRASGTVVASRAVERALL